MIPSRSILSSSRMMSNIRHSLSSFIRSIIFQSLLRTLLYLPCQCLIHLMMYIPHDLESGCVTFSRLNQVNLSHFTVLCANYVFM
ncbi:unnamed protein product [Linum tenue]|uniref:Uncharacterized protein n=1 Tax=Linum tenue TaxID=586396 RepID=A0AAV0NWU7_9ROSI|nr:unnamed protein product [Linum tenue]CAI0463497.1 unnamed protein product [Linum tenue]